MLHLKRVLPPAGTLAFVFPQLPIMLLRQLFYALTIVSSAGAAPASVKHVLHEKRGSDSLDWIRGARVDRDAVLPVRIGLSQNNLEKGEQFLMEVSHPGSARYGKFWSAEEVHDMFAPSTEAVNSVREWLELAGIHASRVVHSDNKGWLAFDAKAHEAEELFKTEFYEHEHPSAQGMKIGCEEYHVPEHLRDHIDYVTPGIKMSSVKKRNVKRASHLATAQPNAKAVSSDDSYHSIPAKALNLPTELQDCGVNITPACLKAMYGIPDATKATKGNSLGLYEQGDYFAEEDLDLYWANALNGGEADIDIDMAYSLIYPQTVTLYQVDDQIYEPKEIATTNLFNTFLDALDGSYCTYSAYGETGDDPNIDPVYPTQLLEATRASSKADLPIAYTKRQCNEFLKLGLQGHSILFASGDYGVASLPGDGGKSGCLGPEGKVFNPQYPSNCPYVTSVGGTMLYPDQTVEDPESVMHVDLGGTASNFSSSGGFSNYFPQPFYQKLAVEEYFRKAKLSYPYYAEIGVDVNTTQGLYNRIGRAYPDVAANGAHFCAFNQGRDTHYYGASLASPLFASVLNLIIEERLAEGKGPLGFINPVLYSHPEILNDITNGTNVGCGTEGFSAIEGWDPVTGLGTPNFPKMKELFLSLP
ncbi:Aorsin [Penicillium chermesinum]|uniref:Aorsin n=1 Tax=Penicillium chermesinum TaxID=63820 RepID=A0A9W9NZ77_9EURO|nr:Aorsin [Penicillium chermesinum]KAJ5232473.1 Aorsin [Penicillium chermesinum]